MTRHLRAAVALAALLCTAAPAWAETPQWPQATSDLRADPAIRFGVLPNGMRYAIRRQTIPPNQGAIRLWFDTGSLNETDAQQGLAHFLEHMAFNGSKNVKEGEMTRMLERLGLAFGPDTNASTSFGQTIYMLDLPRTNDETVDTSLMLMREAASNLSIDQAAVDREKGIVLSEERARDTPGYRVLKARLQFWLKGQRLPDRLPIGKVEVLRSAQASDLTAYYRAFYRPERAVLVVAGDFDVDAMEAKIRARFSDWRAQGQPGTPAAQGQVRPRGPEARLVIEPGAQLSLQIAWVRPPDNVRDTVAERQRDLIRNLGLAVLNRRYARIARAPNPPFLGAASSRSEIEDEAEVTVVGVTAEPGKWAPALAAAEQEQRRLVQHGVRQDELDREITELRTSLQAAVAGAATRRPAELVNEIVGTLDDDEVVTSPADDLALFEKTVKGLTAETVSAALKANFQGSGPLVFMASPQPVAGGEDALLAALQASTRTAVAAPAAGAAIAWPYERFGAPGKVAERREVADLKTTFVRFENGVRLTVKSTQFRDDEVLVRVNVGEGLRSLPADRQSPSWMSSTFTEGGLKKIAADDIEQALASKLVGARFSIGEEAFVLSGATRPADLPTQLQLLAAYAVEPGWRDEAFARLKRASRTYHDQFESTTSGVLTRDLNGLLRSGDRRWTFPSREELADAQLEQLKAVLEPGLAGPMDVVIVGDVPVETAVQAVAATFGALPPRPEPQAAAAEAPRFAKGGGPPVVLTHKGRADQAVAFMAWPTADYWSDPQRARETAVLSEVMNLRLIDELRESQGATYSPSVSVSHSLVWQGWGFLSASVEVPPDRIQPFFDDVAKIVADLKAREPSADELARAKKPRLERIQKNQLTNQYWLGELSGAHRDPRRLEAIRETLPGTEKVTAADVRRAAQTWLRDETAYRVIVRPAAGAAAAAP